MKPRELLELARELLGARHAREVHWREAARLSYYAVYHLLAQHFGIDAGMHAGSHEAIRRELLSQPSADSHFIRLAKQNLKSLFDARNQADYRLCERLERQAAEASLARAEQIFDSYERELI